MIDCLFKSCNLTTNLLADKPEWAIILFDYLNTIVFRVLLPNIAV